MPLIIETIVTTADIEGNPHISPLGLIEHNDRWVIAPFRPSKTLTNLFACSRFVASHTDDARHFAGLVTGRRTWPMEPTRPGYPPRLADAITHWELEVEEVLEDPVRPRLICRVQGRGSHAPYSGHNRAFAAVVEASVLISRLHHLPRHLVNSELIRLRNIMNKTAGPRETEAFHWLERKSLKGTDFENNSGS